MLVVTAPATYRRRGLHPARYFPFDEITASATLRGASE
jgi:hypothetical protein